jgi:hypothetical protein
VSNFGSPIEGGRALVFPFWFLTFWFRQWARGARRGKFETGEISVRALELSQLWVARWGSFAPIGHRLREVFPDRWARFHTLPRARRVARTRSERKEILARHHAILNELRDISGDTNFLVIAEDWGWNDVHAGWVSRTVPDAWPWRIATDDSERNAPESYIWVSPELTTLEELDAVLLSAADDEGMAIVTDEGLNWLYWPFSGGSDVVAPSSEWRDILEVKYSDWLSWGGGEL